MPEPPLKLPKQTISDIETYVSATVANGGHIRGLLANHSGKHPWDESWEVDAAVEALNVFSSRWSVEILTALYIAGPKRFNKLKGLLSGISSRTLSDKLKFLTEEGFVDRQVDDGPPIKVEYALSSHGRTCGRLLSPLVAHLKLENGSLITQAE